MLVQGDNYEGQCGNGQTGSYANIGDDETPGQAGHVILPSYGTGFSSGSGSGGHSCVILPDGSASCFGTNYAGQCGVNPNSWPIANAGSSPAMMPRILPPGYPTVTIVQIVTGSEHTCFLLSNNEVRCLGSAQSGQLGTGTATDTYTMSTPVALGNTPVLRIVSSDYATCALLQGGEVRCWGDLT